MKSFTASDVQHFIDFLNSSLSAAAITSKSSSSLSLVDSTNLLSQHNSTQTDVAAFRHTKFIFKTSFLPTSAHCARDYSVNCPQGWRDESGQGDCHPAVSYQGPCTSGIHLMDESDKNGKPAMSDSSDANNNDSSKPQTSNSAKEEISHRCRVKWPCISDTDPRGLKESKGVFVETDTTIGGAEIDYLGSACPLGWELIRTGNSLRPDYVCHAPEIYTGPCYPRQNLTGLTGDEKRQFSEICKAPFPEKENGDSIDLDPEFPGYPGSKCPLNKLTGKHTKPDWSLPCPKDWDFIQSTNTCKAPPWYVPDSGDEDGSGSGLGGANCPSEVPAFQESIGSGGGDPTPGASDGSTDLNSPTNIKTKVAFVKSCKLRNGWSCAKQGACSGNGYAFKGRVCPKGWYPFKGFCMPPRDLKMQGMLRDQVKCRRAWSILDISSESVMREYFEDELRGIIVPTQYAGNGKAAGRYLFQTACGAFWECLES